MVKRMALRTLMRIQIHLTSLRSMEELPLAQGLRFCQYFYLGRL